MNGKAIRAETDSEARRALAPRRADLAALKIGHYSAGCIPLRYGAITTDFLQHNDGFLTTFEVKTNGTRRVVGSTFR